MLQAMPRVIKRVASFYIHHTNPARVLAHGKVKPAFMIFQDFITGWPKQSIFIHVISRNYFYVRKNTNSTPATTALRKRLSHAIETYPALRRRQRRHT